MPNRSTIRPRNRGIAEPFADSACSARSALNVVTMQLLDADPSDAARRHAGARVGRGAVRARVPSRPRRLHAPRARGCARLVPAARRSSTSETRSSSGRARGCDAYFAGTRGRRLRRCRSTCAARAFEQRVWKALRDDSRRARRRATGRSRRRLGRPGASRAVGMANGANPIAIIVPCHRVIGADGSLTGYGGGLDRKRG